MSVRSVVISRVKPVPIAGPVTPGADGKLNGRIEMQCKKVIAVELGDRPDFKWGDGYHLEAAPTATSIGGVYFQEGNPDAHEWWALADPAGASDGELRVLDSRRET